MHSANEPYATGVRAREGTATGDVQILKVTRKGGFVTRYAGRGLTLFTLPLLSLSPCLSFLLSARVDSFEEDFLAIHPSTRGRSKLQDVRKVSGQTRARLAKRKRRVRCGVSPSLRDAKVPTAGRTAAVRVT